MSNLSNGDVVTVMTATGEYVGKLEYNDGNGKVTLEDPRFVSMSEKGMGFAGGIAMTGVKDPKSVTLFNVSFIAECNPDVSAAYRQSVSGLITAPAGKIHI